MASKWKYSSLPAQERIDMIRNGNKEVYDDEMNRSMDQIKANQELGLDIDKQKEWIDNISYNYNLYNAQNMGIDASRVNKTGYADFILGGGLPEGSKKKKSAIMVSNKYTRFESAAAELLDEYYKKVSEAAQEINNVKEWLINNGIDENSVDGQKYIKDFEDELARKAQTYNKEYVSKVRALAAKL